MGYGGFPLSDGNGGAGADGNINGTANKLIKVSGTTAGVDSRITDDGATVTVVADPGAGKGLIVAAPHYGNWELLNQWLAAKTPISILYRPPKSAVAEAFLRLVRADGADRVTQIRAEGPAVRQLWKLMKQGGVTGILPDQQPKAGDGEFAPFFGKQALTMTLLNRLAERSGAAVLFAYCERIGEGPEFALRIEAAPPGIAAPDPVAGVHALNAALENIARRDLAQYQWTYKRYTLRPPDSGEDNPYRDLETH